MILTTDRVRENAPQAPRRRFFKLAAVSTAFAGLAGLGVSAFAHGVRHGRQLEPIFKQAANDLLPLRAKGIVRAPTPVITPEELVAECAQATPATNDQALETAEIVLADYLEFVLDGFRYREELRSPRAIRARMAAVALERVRSFQSSSKAMQARVDAWLHANPQYRRL